MLPVEDVVEIASSSLFGTGTMPYGYKPFSAIHRSIAKRYRATIVDRRGSQHGGEPYLRARSFTPRLVDDSIRLIRPPAPVAVERCLLARRFAFSLAPGCPREGMPGRSGIRCRTYILPRGFVLNRLLSGIFVAAVWLCGVPALAAGAATGMDSAIKIHNGVNVVKDGKTTYLVTVKDGKLVSVTQQMSGHMSMPGKPIKVTTVKKTMSKGVAAGYGCYYQYYCWYDAYGRYYCTYQYVCN
jgi:hypothetical protein